ncbi:hypoxanthine phosphoribosyltransferase [Psychroflexus planctonicus]|uniref:Hypoxanthine phosphoribosyltransferase n=1 Tax=Psychroflexus planctonicus TaxID=1526575 RepID=A0ABQ1SFT8_9FLAO|nr:hypoxanthine phosphoribosyltransferase [Psychroflexus planctonicus]GGE37456.1 hypoxanthine phosphoribosyltransferase [Psychroflexus planctonicus]
MIQLHDLQFQPYLSSEEIQETVQTLASSLVADYQDKNPIFVGVLNGAFMFLSDLLQNFNASCEVEFVKMKSYEGTSSTGEVKIDLDFSDLTNRHVIVVEDIVDTGNTLVKINELLQTKNLKSLAFCSLFLKPEVYDKDLEINYVGMAIPNKFIVGYGLDYNGLGRNLPEIYQLKEAQND